MFSLVSFIHLFNCFQEPSILTVILAVPSSRLRSMSNFPIVNAVQMPKTIIFKFKQKNYKTEYLKDQDQSVINVHWRCWDSGNTIKHANKFSRTIQNNNSCLSCPERKWLTSCNMYDSELEIWIWGSNNTCNNKTN